VTGTDFARGCDGQTASRLGRAKSAPVPVTQQPIQHSTTATAYATLRLRTGIVSCLPSCRARLALGKRSERVSRSAGATRDESAPESEARDALGTGAN